jgi:hypothetical protein
MTLVISGGITLVSLNKVSTKYQHVTHDNMGNAQALSEMRDEASIMRRFSIFMDNNDLPPSEVVKYTAKMEEAIVNYAKADKQVSRPTGLPR